ncbi:MAG: DUF1192 domain-containing protein [Alphaproteobacteria bacterium]|nr:DUF1192 domain-containing protein [Alphaproteobacteria bacterium]
MPLDADDLDPKPKAPKPVSLDLLSVDELEARIAQLEAEIGRCREAIGRKRSARGAADTFFKKA